MAKYISIQGITLPVPIEDYITPDFIKGCEYYPFYVFQARTKMVRVLSIQEYILRMAYELEKGDARPGRTRDEYMKRVCEHFGTDVVMQIIQKYGGLTDEADSSASHSEEDKP